MTVKNILENLEAQAAKKVIITGPSQIGGKTRTQGSKNTNNKLLAATAALPGRYRIYNFPIILDALEILLIIEFLGGTVDLDVEQNVAYVDSRNITNKDIPYSMTKSTTGVFGYAGSLLGRFGHVTIGKPGGDKIGPRPVDIHMQGFKALGAITKETEDSISATFTKRPERIQFDMPMPSVGAAVNLALAAVASKGSVRLTNSPTEPDMEALYAMLRQVGVDIALDKSTKVTTIEAANASASSQIVDVHCVPDRNDAVTLLTYGMLSKESLSISSLDVSSIQPAINLYRDLGGVIEVLSNSSVRISAPPITYQASHETIVAGMNEIFHSDWAPLLSVLLAVRPSSATLIDTLYANRARQAEVLQKMGANISIHGGAPPGNVAVLFPVATNEARYIFDFAGSAKLQSVNISIGDDVRASAAAIMTASLAQGTTELSDVRALYRGYEKVADRLLSIGVSIQQT